MLGPSILLKAASRAGSMESRHSAPAREPAPRCNLQNVKHDPAQGTRVAIALFGLLRSSSTTINFEKFLVAADGQVTRFRPTTQPDDPAVIEAIDAALAQRAESSESAEHSA
mgnify:CR=1 FL=1